LHNVADFSIRLRLDQPLRSKEDVVLIAAWLERTVLTAKRVKETMPVALEKVKVKSAYSRVIVPTETKIKTTPERRGVQTDGKTSCRKATAKATTL